MQIEFRNLYHSPTVISMMKSRRMRWADHVARSEALRIAYESFITRTEATWEASA
jgi:hypothetical protein